jgi:hypothetical protein
MSDYSSKPPMTFRYDSQGRRITCQDLASNLVTHVYDAGGGRIAVITPYGATPHYEGAGPPETPKGSAPSRPEAAVPVFRRAFEFRLAGSETQDQSAPLPRLAGGAFVIATNNVRVYLSRRDGATEPAEAIGGVEVTAALRDDALVVSACLSDLGSQEIVVIQLDVDVYAVAG